MGVIVTETFHELIRLVYIHSRYRFFWNEYAEFSFFFIAFIIMKFPEIVYIATVTFYFKKLIGYYFIVSVVYNVHLCASI